MIAAGIQTPIPFLHFSLHLWRTGGFRGSGWPGGRVAAGHAGHALVDGAAGAGPVTQKPGRGEPSMDAIRRVGVVLGAAVLWTACDNPSGVNVGPPAAMTVVAGDLQTGPAGAELPQALVVRVTDADGDPVPDQLVNFVVTAGGGSVFAGAAETNGSGEARERWTLGYVVGDTQRVEVRAVHPTTGEAMVLGSFRAVATPGAPASLSVVDGDAQAGLVASPLPAPLRVLVRDAGGNPVPGATVAWTGSGSFAPAASASGADGIAQTTWTLGGAAGQQTAQASSGASSVQFTATAATGLEVPGRLVVTPDAVTMAAARFSQPVEARWVDDYGNSVPVIPTSWQSLEPLVVEGSLSLGSLFGRTVGSTRVIASIATPRGTSSDTLTVTVTPGTAFAWTAGTPGAPTFAGGTGTQNDYRVAGRHVTGVLARVTGTTLVEDARWTLVGLNGIWGPPGGSLFAVGDSGLVLRYDGSAWSLSPSGTRARLAAVSGSSGTDVWAGGAGGTLLHFDGSGWSAVGSPTDADIEAVWVASTGEVFVAAGSTVFRRTGAGWSAAVLGGPATSLQGASASEVTTVAGGRVYQWNGAAWAALPTFTDSTPGGTVSATFTFAAPSGGSVYAIGVTLCGSRDECHDLYRHDGGTWTKVMSVGSVGRGQNSAPTALVRLHDGALLTLQPMGVTRILVPAPASAAGARSPGAPRR